MSEKIIGVDVDGILAEFNSGYAKKVLEITGENRFPPGTDPLKYIPQTWYWITDSVKGLGYTKDQDRAVWGNIAKDPTFWENLPAYPDACQFLNDLWLNFGRKGTQVYFITSRVGPAVHFQTQKWIQRHGYDNPTVLISTLKGTSCAAVGITHYVDDKDENCQDVYRQCNPSTKCYMIARDWNHTQLGVPRIAGLQDFWKEIANG